MNITELKAAIREYDDARRNVQILSTAEEGVELELVIRTSSGSVVIELDVEAEVALVKKYADKVIADFNVLGEKLGLTK